MLCFWWYCNDCVWYQLYWYEAKTLIKLFSYFQRWISSTQTTISHECYHFNYDVQQYGNIIVETLKFCVFTRPCILSPAKQWYKPTQRSLTFKNQEKNLNCIFTLMCRFCKDVFPIHFSKVLLGLGAKKKKRRIRVYTVTLNLNHT